MIKILIVFSIFSILVILGFKFYENFEEKIKKNWDIFSPFCL